MRAGFVLTLIGLSPAAARLSTIFRILAFPLLFLFLMVPLPQSLVNVIAFPLQLHRGGSGGATRSSWLQIPALREGNIIHLAGHAAVRG